MTVTKEVITHTHKKKCKKELNKEKNSTVEIKIFKIRIKRIEKGGGGSTLRLWLSGGVLTWCE